QPRKNEFKEDITMRTTVCSSHEGFIVPGEDYFRIFRNIPGNLKLHLTSHLGKNTLQALTTIYEIVTSWSNLN
ncbi:unnamed protein product, partial [Allacma fusca]